MPTPCDSPYNVLWAQGLGKVHQNNRDDVLEGPRLPETDDWLRLIYTRIDENIGHVTFKAHKEYVEDLFKHIQRLEQRIAKLETVDDRVSNAMKHTKKLQRRVEELEEAMLKFLMKALQL